MIHKVVTRVSMDSFHEKSKGKKVVLLYPWTNYRNLFLTHFLESAKDGLLYYRVEQDGTTIMDWAHGLVAEFDDVLGGFGKKTTKALKGDSIKKLGKALAEDLGAFKKKNVVFFIDELDRIPLSDDLNKFVSTLVDNLPKHVQLVFSSRLFTQQPWIDMLANGVATVLGTEYRKDDVMFTIEEEVKPQLEIYALGRGHAVVNGQEVSNWDGALPRNLFFYFVDNPMVTRDMIFETFWSDLSTKEATNVFHVTKRKISERMSLKIPGDENYELTNYISGFYMPGDKISRHYDAGDFQFAVERGMVSLDERVAERYFRQAIDLYKAPFLEMMDLPWVIERREQLQMLYAHALIGLAKIHEKRDEKEEALGLFIRSLKEAPQREDIHRKVMELYIELGMVEDARNQFDLVRYFLKKKLKMKPSKRTVELYESIKD